VHMHITAAIAIIYVDVDAVRIHNINSLHNDNDGKSASRTVPFHRLGGLIMGAFSGTRRALLPNSIQKMQQWN